jgi:hypothetical protein
MSLSRVFDMKSGVWVIGFALLLTNTVALCPNCHRELHFGENARGLVSRLYARIARLVRE